MLTRQLETVIAGASGSRLRVARDSAQLGMRLATARRDSAAAAYVLANAANVVGDMGECRRWARLAADLGEAAAATLLQVCQ
jgi:TPR repeat protein